MKNHFGKTSILKITAKNKDEKTILDDIFFTAPFKIIKPFYKENGFMKIMQLMASAGIMEGDVQEVYIEALEKTKVEFLSQSYEKIHKMKDGSAVRKTELKVLENAFFIYNPQPIIPFADSAFESSMRVDLADDTSKFIMCEILSSGRTACGEQFAYRYYHSLVEVRKSGKLIYRDNSRYDRGKYQFEKIGMFEGYTHIANLLFCNIEKDENWIFKIRELLDCHEKIQGGISRLQSGDVIIRMLGSNSQVLQNVCNVIMK